MDASVYDNDLLQRLLVMFPDAAPGIQALMDGQQQPAAPTPAATPPEAPVGGLGGLGGMPAKNPNEWAPPNATDIMWLQQNNPQQLLTNAQIEARQPGYDPAKSKWGASPYNAGNGFGQALMDSDTARLTGAYFGSRS